MTWTGACDPSTQDLVSKWGVISRRLLSWAIDAVLVAVGLVALHVALLAFGLLTLGLGLPLLAVLPAVPFLYTLGCVAGFGATPGQSLAGLCVRSDITLTPPGGLQALLYTAGYWLTVATGGLLFLVVLLTPRGRALHDMLGGVVVLRADALTPHRLPSARGVAA